MPSPATEPAGCEDATLAGAFSLRICCVFGDAATAVFGLMVDAVCDAGVHLLAQRSLSIAWTFGEAAVRSLQQVAEQHASDPPARTELAEAMNSPATAAIIE
jgi:hypothetical protein